MIIMETGMIVAVLISFIILPKPNKISLTNLTLAFYKLVQFTHT